MRSSYKVLKINTLCYRDRFVKKFPKFIEGLKELDLYNSFNNGESSVDVSTNKSFYNLSEINSKIYRKHRKKKEFKVMQYSKKVTNLYLRSKSKKKSPLLTLPKFLTNELVNQDLDLIENKLFNSNIKRDVGVSTRLAKRVKRVKTIESLMVGGCYHGKNFVDEDNIYDEDIDINIENESILFNNTAADAEDMDMGYQIIDNKIIYNNKVEENSEDLGYQDVPEFLQTSKTPERPKTKEEYLIHETDINIQKKQEKKARRKNRALKKQEKLKQAAEEEKPKVIPVLKTQQDLLNYSLSFRFEDFYVPLEDMVEEEEEVIEYTPID